MYFTSTTPRCMKTEARFPFKRKCLRCVRCVNKNRRNASACVGKQPIMVATASTEHSYWLVLTQAPANRNARSKQWQPWLAAWLANATACVSCSFRLRNARKRLHLNGNRALRGRVKGRKQVTKICLEGGRAVHACVCATYRSCKMMNDKLQVLVPHSLKLSQLLRKRPRHFLDQREIGRLRKPAFLVN